MSLAKSQLEPLWKIEGLESVNYVGRLIHNNEIIVGKRDGYLWAWNINTGQSIWKTDFAVGDRIHTYDNVVTTIDNETLNLVALDIKIGKVLWTVAANSFLGEPLNPLLQRELPLYYDWVFYNNELIVVPFANYGIAPLTIYDAYTGEEVWQSNFLFENIGHSGFSLDGDFLYIQQPRRAARSPMLFVYFDISSRAATSEYYAEQIKMSFDQYKNVDGRFLKFSSDNTLGEIDINSSLTNYTTPPDCPTRFCFNNSGGTKFDFNSSQLSWTWQTPFSLWQDGEQTETDSGGTSTHYGGIKTSQIAWYKDAIWVIDGDSKLLYQYSPSQQSQESFDMTICQNTPEFVRSGRAFSVSSTVLVKAPNGYVICEQNNSPVLYSLANKKFIFFDSISPFNLRFMNNKVIVFSIEGVKELGDSLIVYDLQTGISTLRGTLNGKIGEISVSNNILLVEVFNITKHIYAFDLASNIKR
jgi:outer membrane protein assembly factor BamB